MHGGARLLQDYLAVENKDLAEEFGVSEDLFFHEYSWTLDDVKEALLSGTMDKLADALDFAPQGIIDTIISQAVILNIPNMNKQKLISEATGHDISRMIENQEKLKKAIGENNSTPERKTRRVGQDKEIKPQGRRVQ